MKSVDSAILRVRHQVQKIKYKMEVSGKRQEERDKKIIIHLRLGAKAH